jgi:branched-chain amino acid transport system permease protein
MSGTLKTRYEQELALFQNLWVKAWFGIFVALVLVCPLFMSRYQLSILNEMSIAVIGALGLNLLVGYTGQISLCHGGFLAIGAYTTALASEKLGLPFIITLPLSGLMAALLGMIVGIPALRLKGLYLALGTLAFGFIIDYVLFHWDLTQGDMGMPVKRISIGGYAIRTETQFFYFVVAFAALATVCAKNIARSKIGRNFVAIRDRDVAAEAMGIALSKHKVMAFGISSFYAGVAGALLAHYLKWIVPGAFGLSLSIAYIAMVILGGLGTILGSVLGAVLITGIPHAIVYATDSVKDTYPALGSLIVDLKMGIFGLIVVLALLFEPQGLAGTYRRIKVYWKTWPFRY